MNLKLIRHYDNGLTDGELFDDKAKHICWTLELPDKNNQPEISCIPEGTYPYGKMFSQHLGWVYRLQNVPDRSLIDVHKANTILDLRGCIGVGTKQGTLNIKGKNYPAVLNSGDALNNLFTIAGNSGFITITGDNNDRS